MATAAPRTSIAGPSTRPPRLKQTQRRGSVPNLKGKSLAPVPENSALARERSRRLTKKDVRPGWVLDLEVMKGGRSEWLQRDRVILVLGDPSEASLNSILYSSAFAKTLILLCLSKSVISISKWKDSVGCYPAIQVVEPASSCDAKAHPLPSLLLAAQAQARAWLTTQATPQPTGTTTPTRLPSFLSHTRAQSSSSATPRIMTSSDSFRSLPPTPINPYALSSELSKSRYSSFALSAMSRKPSQASSTAREAGPVDGEKRTPFDAILNFLPSGQDETLQTLLQQTLTLTTGVTPYLMTRVSVTAPSLSSLPISLIHILPERPPSPLEKVLESFLLTLLPSLAPRATQRKAQGLVVTRAVWDAEARMEAAHCLLFGGLICPVVEGQNAKGRALLRDWMDCSFRDDLETIETPERDCVTPTFPLPTPSEMRPRPHSRSTAPAAVLTPPEHTPDLISDSSSVSEENSLSSARVSQELAGKQVVVMKEKPRGFKGWMKSKMGRS